MALELNLTLDEIEELKIIASTRTESHCRVQRAKIILDYVKNNSIASASRAGNVVRSVTRNCLEKIKLLGIKNGLNDRQRAGRPRSISEEAKAWVISLACQKPKDLLINEKNPYELWTLSLLAEYIRKNCSAVGHDCLSKTQNGNLHNILNKNHIKPHKIKYYLERRDKNHEVKKKSI